MTTPCARPDISEVDPSLFEAASEEEKAFDRPVRPNVTYWQDAWRRLKENRLAMCGLVFIVAIVACAVVIPIVSPDYYSNHFERAN